VSGQLYTPVALISVEGAVRKYVRM